jgi:Tol biopolymer transport system component
VGGRPTDTYENLMRALSQTRLGIQTQITYWSKAEGQNKTVAYTFGNESSLCLRDPAVSPDSKSVAVALGMSVDRFNFDSRELVIVPLDPMGINGAKPLLAGRVFEPHWHPSGEKLTFAMVGPSGDSQIYVIGIDGAGQKNVSGAGEFGSPKFSPMLRKR